MLGGGIPESDHLLVACPSGAGKSILASQFIAEGLRIDEAGIIVIFEERPDEYVGRADGFGLGFEKSAKAGALTITYLRPLDLSVDETMREILDAAAARGEALQYPRTRELERTGAPAVVVRPGLVSYWVWAILGEDDRPEGVMIQVADTTEAALPRRRVVVMNEAPLASSTRQHELIEASESLGSGCRKRSPPATASSRC